MAMYVLHGARTGNSMRAAIALTEAGVSFVAQPVDLMTGEQLRDPFLRLNPDAKVPVLTITDERGTRHLTQSNAIMFYAARLVPGRLLPEDPTELAEALERFFFVVTDVIAPNTSGFILGRRNEPQAARLLLGLAIERAAALERFLSETPFVAGKRFTLADIAAFTVIRSMEAHLDWAALPATAEWVARVATRHGTRSGLAAFG